MNASQRIECAKLCGQGIAIAAAGAIVVYAGAVAISVGGYYLLVAFAYRTRREEELAWASATKPTGECLAV